MTVRSGWVRVVGHSQGLAVFAVLGPLVYVFAVALGGAMWPGYSQYAMSISTLTSTGAPNQAILIPLFALYNLALLDLAFGLDAAARPRRGGRLGPAFLGVAAVAGLVVLAVPQGPWADPLSGTGVAHTAIAGVDALSFLLALAFLAPRLRHDVTWRTFGMATWALLLVGILAGGFGAASVAAPYAGVAERVSIGVFMVWTEWGAVQWLRTLGTAPVPDGSGGARLAPA